MTGDDLLGDAVEELYSADPEDFTRRRGELAAAARAAGQAAAAKQIAGLRKPTRSAWVINQLARSDPEAASSLAALGADLREAERSGDGSRLRELSQARRRLIAALVRQALAVSGQHAAPAAMREEITTTLAAALADPEVAEEIRNATLLRPAQRAGFGSGQAPTLALVPPPADTRQAGARAAKPARAAPADSQGTAGTAAGTSRIAAGRGRRAGPDEALAGAGRDRRAGSLAGAGRDRRDQAEEDAEADEARAAAERDRRAGAEADAERQRRAQAAAERALADAERARRQARAEAEQALDSADRAVQATRNAEQELQDTVKQLEQQLTDLRRRLHDARAQARQAQIAQRKARQVLGRLPE